MVFTQTSSSSSVLPTPSLVILVPASLSQPSLPHLHLLSFFPSSLALSLWVPTRSYHRDQRYHGNCGLQQRRQQTFSLSLTHTNGWHWYVLYQEYPQHIVLITTLLSAPRLPIVCLCVHVCLPLVLSVCVDNNVLWYVWNCLFIPAPVIHVI